MKYSKLFGTFTYWFPSWFLELNGKNSVCISLFIVFLQLFDVILKIVASNFNDSSSGAAGWECPRVSTWSKQQWVDNIATEYFFLSVILLSVNFKSSGHIGNVNLNYVEKRI